MKTNKNAVGSLKTMMNFICKFLGSSPMPAKYFSFQYLEGDYNIVSVKVNGTDNKKLRNNSEDHQQMKPLYLSSPADAMSTTDLEFTQH